jgi:hypothetical protein
LNCIWKYSGNHVIITLSSAINLIEAQEVSKSFLYTSQNWNISINKHYTKYIQNCSEYAWFRIENINKLYNIGFYAQAKRLQWKLRKKRTLHMLEFDWSTIRKTFHSSNSNGTPLKKLKFSKRCPYKIQGRNLNFHWSWMKYRYFMKKN